MKSITVLGRLGVVFAAVLLCGLFSAAVSAQPSDQNSPTDETLQQTTQSNAAPAGQDASQACNVAKEKILVEAQTVLTNAEKRLNIYRSVRDQTADMVVSIGLAGVDTAGLQQELNTLSEILNSYIASSLAFSKTAQAIQDVDCRAKPEDLAVATGDAAELIGSLRNDAKSLLLHVRENLLPAFGTAKSALENK